LALLLEQILEVYPEEEEEEEEEKEENGGEANCRGGQAKRVLTQQVVDWLEGQMRRVHGYCETTEEGERAARLAVACSRLYCPADLSGSATLIELAVCLSRRLIIAQDGAIGVGPWCMEPGDVVIALFGGNALYGLRPTGTPGDYLYLGEWYLQGYMHGEGMDLFEKGEVQAEYFNLR
jgi:hypothetical protein